jgi:hypothetical protein
MSTTDTIPISLSMAERHTLADLLTRCIHERVEEAIRFAGTSLELERAAERTRRLALVKALAEGGDEMELPRTDLDAIRGDLLMWAMETEATVEEHDQLIYETGDRREGSAEEREERIARLRTSSAVDYAHKCVCEAILYQLDVARERVTA